MPPEADIQPVEFDTSPLAEGVDAALEDALGGLVDPQDLAEMKQAVLADLEDDLTDMFGEEDLGIGAQEEEIESATTTRRSGNRQYVPSPKNPQDAARHLDQFGERDPENIVAGVGEDGTLSVLAEEDALPDEPLEEMEDTLPEESLPPPSPDTLASPDTSVIPGATDTISPSSPGTSPGTGQSASPFAPGTGSTTPTSASQPSELDDMFAPSGDTSASPSETPGPSAPTAQDASTSEQEQAKQADKETPAEEGQEDAEEASPTDDTDEESPESEEPSLPEEEAPSDTSPEEQPKESPGDAAGQEAQPEGTPQAAGDQPPAEAGEPTDQKPARLPSEKGLLTQGFNKIRNKKPLRKLEKQIKEAENKEQQMQKDLRNHLKKMAPVDSDFKRLKRSLQRKQLVRIFALLLLVFSIFTIILIFTPIPTMLFGWAGTLSVQIANERQKKEEKEKTFKELEKKRVDMVKSIRKQRNLIRGLMNQRYRLEHQGLLSRRPR